jgi:hypothetical protein
MNQWDGFFNRISFAMVVAKDQNYKQWYTFQYFPLSFYPGCQSLVVSSLLSQEALAPRVVFFAQIKKVTPGNEKAMINDV